jgi:hypothetical protein
MGRASSSRDGGDIKKPAAVNAEGETLDVRALRTLTETDERHCPKNNQQDHIRPPLSKKITDDVIHTSPPGVFLM